jgi:choline-sulfatase
MSFFEPACRIPLIVSAPGRFAARRVASPASLLDILPTLVELGSPGTSPDYAAPLDGRSLVAELNGKPTGAPDTDEVVGEYLAEAAIAPIVMIRRGRYKFVYSPVDPDQLYDLAADPDERVNLAADAKAGSAAATRVAGFRAEVARRWTLNSIHADVLASQQRRHMVYAALRSGRYTPWDFQPRRDASRQYVRNDQELNDIEAMARFPRPSC